MSTAARRRISPEEYLGLERQGDLRHEYFHGEMFAMSGATRAHNLLVTNLVRELSSQLKDGCEVYSNDMRLQVERTGLYTYPDVVVVCGEPKFADAELDTLLNPKLVIEVLSKPSEAYDRGRKFAHYRQLDNLTDYLLVSQQFHLIELYSRQPDGNWKISEARGPDSTVEIPSLNCRLPLAEIYRQVTLEAPTDDQTRLRMTE